MSVGGAINGLYPTKRRIALCEAITEAGQVYGEAGQTWLKRDAGKITDRVRELLHFGWAEPIPHDGYAADWSPQRTYFRLTEFGRAAIERGRR